MTRPLRTPLARDRMDPHRLGLLLTAIGGIALSFDVPLVRLGGGGLQETLALRSISTFCLGIAVWLVVRRLAPNKPSVRPGKPGWLAGALYGLSTITFLGAVFNTSTANVVFIVAFTPMFAALLGWLTMNERPHASTLVTMVVMVAGVGLIVSGGLEGGALLGNLSAVATALLLAGAITVGRKTGAELGLVPLLATIIPAVVGMVMIADSGFNPIPQPGWVLLDGLIVLPLAFWCLATGPKYLSGPEVGMFYLLETVLAPVWVWMIFNEEIAMRTLAGGTVLVLALIGHSLWQVRRMRLVPGACSDAA